MPTIKSSVRNAEALAARLEPLVSEKYKVVISERLKVAIEGYLDVAKKYTQTLIDLTLMTPDRRRSSFSGQLDTMES